MKLILKQEVHKNLKANHVKGLLRLNWIKTQFTLWTSGYLVTLVKNLNKNQTLSQGHLQLSQMLQGIPLLTWEEEREIIYSTNNLRSVLLPLNYKKIRGLDQSLHLEGDIRNTNSATLTRLVHKQFFKLIKKPQLALQTFRLNNKDKRLQRSELLLKEGLMKQSKGQAQKLSARNFRINNRVVRPKDHKVSDNI